MYAVFHPPNFSAQVVVHEHPELRKRPFVLLNGERPAEIVFAANKAARSLGIEVGMTRTSGILPRHHLDVSQPE